MSSSLEKFLVLSQLVQSGLQHKPKVELTVVGVFGPESPSRHDRRTDDAGCQRDSEPGEDGGGGGADGRWGALGERTALLGQQGERT